MDLLLAIFSGLVLDSVESQNKSMNRMTAWIHAGAF
jgi:hypothetical protein